MSAGLGLLIALCLVPWFAIWARYGTRVAMVILMVAGAMVGLLAYWGVFNH